MTRKRQPRRSRSTPKPGRGGFFTCFGFGNGTKQRKHRATTQQRRPRFEPLEDRQLLSVSAIHQELTAEALPELISGGSGAPLVLEDINNEHLGQNSTNSPSAQPDHFHGSRFREAAQQINAWYAEAVAYADPNSFSSEHLADDFGKVLHAVQDFYAHSNWAELQAAGLIRAGALLDTGSSWFGNLSPYSLVSGAMLVQGEDETPLGPDSRLQREGLVVGVNTGNHVTDPLGAVNAGVAVHPGVFGTGYLLYSDESLFTRFSGQPPRDDETGRNSDRVIAVSLDPQGQWFYSDGDGWFAFEPQPGDRLLAEVNFSDNSITSLEGPWGWVGGIAKGYDSGNLSFASNTWNDAPAEGQFTVTGSSFQASVVLPGVIAGSVNEFYGGDDTPDSVALSHGGLLGDGALEQDGQPTLAKDEPDAPLYAEAFELAAAQTRHELFRLFNLVEAEYGSNEHLIAAWIKPDQAVGFRQFLSDRQDASAPGWEEFQSDVQSESIDGLTVVTHGFQTSNSGGDSLLSLADAIHQRAGGWLIDLDITEEGGKNTTQTRCAI